MKMKNHIIFASLVAVAILYGCVKPKGPDRENLQQPVLSVTGSNDSIYFRWNKVPSANKYEVFYKNPKVLSNLFITAPLLNDSIAYATLFYPATRYQAWVRAIDTGTWSMSPAMVAVEFTTPCMPLRSVTVDQVTTTTARTNWMGSTPADHSDISSFSVYLRLKNDPNFESYVTDQHFYTFQGLSPATDYEVKVGFTCTDGMQYATDWKTFKTQ